MLQSPFHVTFTLPCYMLHSPSNATLTLPCCIHPPMLHSPSSATFTIPCCIHPPMIQSPCHVTFTIPCHMLHSPSHVTCYIHPAVLHSPMAWCCRPPGAGEGAAQRDVRLHHRGPVGACLSRAGQAGGQLRRHVGGDGGWRLLHCHHHLHLRPASAHPAGCKSCRVAALPVCLILSLSISLPVSQPGVHGLAHFDD